MPLGRDVHSTKPFALPNLDEDTLVRMRADPDPIHLGKTTINDSSSDSDEEGKATSGLPGTFPGSSANGSKDSVYY